MAIPVNVDELVAGHVVESTRIEFKASFNPNPIVHTICAFANDIDNIGGGYLVIGVEERDGSPVLPPKGVPQDEVDGILKRLVGLCRCIEPLYNPVVEPVLFQGVYVIVVWVPGGHGRPYKAAKDVLAPSKTPQHYYIRKFSSTMVASPREEKELFYVSTDIPYDDRPNLLASVDDLDLGLMREHLKQVGSALYRQSEDASMLEVAQNMQLVAGPPEDRHPLNVGLLMFSEHPERFFRYARIEVVDIPDPTGAGMVETTFTGPVQRQLKDALLYIKNYIIKTRTEKLADEAEARVVSNYPYAAVEELLSNAVYHRSYQIAEPITVRVTPESLEITSFPGFDRSIADEDIAGYRIRARVYRNRRIGDFLKELHLIEGRNTGFPNAFEALRRNGSELPKFQMDENRGYLSVVLPVHASFAPADERGDAYRARILDALEEGPLTLTELAAALGYKGISKKLRDAVESLVATGALGRVADGRSVKIRRM
jgi:ATP-dependent DNA helicase RecG